VHPASQERILASEFNGLSLTAAICCWDAKCEISVFLAIFHFFARSTES